MTRIKAKYLAPSGSNGQVLTFDGGQTNSMKWATPSAGASLNITTFSTLQSLISTSPTGFMVAYCTANGQYYIGAGNTWHKLSAVAAVNTAPTNSITQTNMILWLDASSSDYLTIDSNNKITGWMDFSPNDASITFPSGKNPIYTQNAKGSLSCAHFNGSQMVITNVTQANSSISIFMVVKFEDSSGNGGSVLTHNTANGATGGSTFNYGLYGIDGSCPKAYIGDGSGTDNPFSGYTLSYNTFCLLEFVIANGTATCYLNGTQALTGSFTKTYAIKLSIADQGYRPFIGTLGEIIVYSGGITASDRTSIESYLKTKWSLS